MIYLLANCCEFHWLALWAIGKHFIPARGQLQLLCNHFGLQDTKSTINVCRRNLHCPLSIAHFKYIFFRSSIKFVDSSRSVAKEHFSRAFFLWYFTGKNLASVTPCKSMRFDVRKMLTDHKYEILFESLRSPDYSLPYSSSLIDYSPLKRWQLL